MPTNRTQRLGRFDRRSESSRRFRQSRQRGSEENRLSSPPGSPMRCRLAEPGFCFRAFVRSKGDGAIEVTRGVHGKHSRNGCKLTLAVGQFLRKEIIADIGDGSHAAALSFPLRRCRGWFGHRGVAVAPTFPVRLTSLLLPWLRITPLERFRSASAHDNSMLRVVHSVKARNELERKVSERTAICSGARPT